MYRRHISILAGNLKTIFIKLELGKFTNYKNIFSIFFLAMWCNVTISSLCNMTLSAVYPSTDSHKIFWPVDDISHTYVTYSPVQMKCYSTQYGHMWLKGCHNPYKMEQSWKCTFLKLFTHMKTKSGWEKDFILDFRTTS